MSNHNHNGISRYRPVLTGPQISHLIALCKRDGTKTSLSCLSQLALYEFKIQNELLEAAYVSPEKQTLEEQLGFSEGSLVVNHAAAESSNNPEALYNAWLEDPTCLSISQILGVQKYRYENNKMTIE